MTGEAGTSTLSRIRTALDLVSREATIHDVKLAVIEEFERADRRVQIKATDYFRHSFVPDLVLRWSDDVDRAERWVFLRSKVEPGYLLDDLATVARDQPIIFGLTPTDATDDSQGASGSQSDDRVRDRSAATGTLITDPLGLDALSAPNPVAAEMPISSLVTRQIIRGGRGLYDEEASRDTAATINAGFVAAFQTDPEVTFRAANSIREHLGEKSGARLLRLLHAIWIGSGGRSDQFPDAPAVDGPLSDDALELLLTSVDVPDESFWKRLVDVSLSQLGRLQVGDRPANLGRLIAVAADRIEGRWCRVVPDQPRVTGGASLRWGIEAGALALHGPTFTAYLALEKSHLEGVPPIEQPGIDFNVLPERAGRAEASISDVTAAGEGLIIGVASETHSDVLANPHTSGSVGAAASNITRATATLRNGRIVSCDFTTSTASSRTVGTLSLRELVRHGLPLVWNLLPGEMDELSQMLAPVATIDTSASPQLSLFEEVDNDLGVSSASATSTVEDGDEDVEENSP